MLSVDEICEVASMMEQVGEPRPGFLHDGLANIEGDIPVIAGMYAEACDFGADGDEDVIVVQMHCVDDKETVLFGIS